MQVVLENEALKVTINSFGAELASIRGKATDTEYLWNADAKFWKRACLKQDNDSWFYIRKVE